MSQLFGEAQTSQKTTVIVFINNAQIPSFVKYNYTEDYSIYIFNGVDLYSQAATYLIKKSSVPPIFVAVYTSLESFLPIMQFLHGFKQEHKQKIISEEYLDYYRSYNNTSVPERISCSMPLSVSLVIAVDHSVFEDDPTLDANVMTQQALRLISLLHGGSFTIVHKLNTTLESDKNNNELGKVIRDCGYPSTPESAPAPFPILEFDNDSKTTALLVPRGWDSWNKITLVSKSIVFDPELSAYTLLTANTNPDAVISAYSNYVNKDTDVSLVCSLFKRNIKPAKNGVSAPSLPEENVLSSFEDLVAVMIDRI